METCNKPQWAEQQLTTQEAVNFYQEKLWDNWTDEQIVRFQLFQKKTCSRFF